MSSGFHIKLQKKYISFVLASLLISSIYQNCGGFSADNSSSNASNTNAAASQSILPQVKAQITTYSAQATNTQSISFSTYQTDLPKGASLAWSHIQTYTNAGKTAYAVCKEISKPTDGIYVLSCQNTGNIQVNLVIVQSGQIVGQASLKSNVDAVLIAAGGTGGASTGGGVVSTDPQYIAGASLYNTNCLKCHGEVSISDRRYISSDQLIAAIVNNAGGMGGALGPKANSVLSSTDIDNIVYALSH